MTLPEFLNYAATLAGISAIVAFLLSFAEEWLPGFCDVDAKRKRLYMMLLSFVVPILATVAAGRYDQAAIWSALSAGFASFFVNQAAHARKL